MVEMPEEKALEKPPQKLFQPLPKPFQKLFHPPENQLPSPEKLIPEGSV
jgi:hypothetical protein